MFWPAVPPETMPSDVDKRLRDELRAMLEAAHADFKEFTGPSQNSGYTAANGEPVRVHFRKIS